MSKSNKKKKPVRQQNKQTEAARLNFFLRQLKMQLLACGCGEVYELLPDKYKQVLYTLRCQPLKVYPENCEHLDSAKLHLLEKQINGECEGLLVPLQKGGNKISVKQFFTIGLSLLLIQELSKKEPFPKAERVRQLMLEKMDLLAAEEKARNHLDMLALMLTFLHSEPNKFYLGIDMKIDRKKANGHFAGLEFYIHTHSPKSRTFILDNHPRPAFQLGVTVKDQKMLWTRINRSYFDQTPFDEQETIPVYIQSHALNRIRERLDIYHFNYEHWPLYILFDHPKVIRHQGYHLIEYVIERLKLGYLVAEVVNNALLVKTFLFLTHEGTPEGEKLKELSGMSKIDMQYWNIDRLSTFCHSDIRQHEDLKKLFILAGCGDLFNATPMEEKTQTLITQAMAMARYLEVKEVESDV